MESRFFEGDRTVDFCASQVEGPFHFCSLEVEAGFGADVIHI